MIRDKVGGKLAPAARPRRSSFGSIEVSLGHAVLRDVEIRGPLDGDTPLVHIDRIDVDFDPWRSLVGIGAARRGEGRRRAASRCAATRTAATTSRDVIERLRGKDAAGEGAGGSGGAGCAPTSITVTHAQAARRRRGHRRDRAGRRRRRDVDAGRAGRAGCAASRRRRSPRRRPSAATIEITQGVRRAADRSGRGRRDRAVAEARAVGDRRARSIANPTHPGEYVIDLTGGYGGVPGKLWTAKGGLDPRRAHRARSISRPRSSSSTGSRRSSRSRRSSTTRTTSVDTKLHLERRPRRREVRRRVPPARPQRRPPDDRGQGGPRPRPVGQDRRQLRARETRQLELTRGDFVARDVPFSITGSASAPRRDPTGEAARRSRSPQAPASRRQRADASGPGGLQVAEAAPRDPADRLPARARTRSRSRWRRTWRATRCAACSTPTSSSTIDWADLDATRARRPRRDQALPGRRRAGRLAEAAQGGVRALRRGRAGRVDVVRRRAEPTTTSCRSIRHLAVPHQVDHDDRGLGVLPAPRLHHVSEFRTALVNNLKAGKFRTARRRSRCRW